MTVDADIGNRALSRLGTRATISSLTENSAEARAINTWFAPTRDAILRARNWNFAKVTAALALSGTAPTRWTYSYAFPSDCLRFIEIDRGAVVSIATTPLLGFEIGSDGTNRFIWTDVQEAVGVYLQRVTDLSRADPEFLNALVDALAAAIAFPITQKRDVAQVLAQQAKATLEAAAADSANEDAMQGRGGAWADFTPDAISARD